MIKYILTSILLLTLISSSVGQNNNSNQLELDSGNIESQFDYILTKSTRWKEFQLIRKTSLLKVKDNVLDSLGTIRKNLISTNQSSSQLELKINSLNKEVVELKNEILIISENIDGISFFGVLINKSTYNVIVWSFIIVLLLAVTVILLKFKNNQLITNRTKNELTKIENEHEEFRKKSLKKEQEIMRKLQDEINKNAY
jgi:membrane protein insertase Oxa1/YidC/SpoIIIJ